MTDHKQRYIHPTPRADIVAFGKAALWTLGIVLVIAVIQWHVIGGM